MWTVIKLFSVRRKIIKLWKILFINISMQDSTWTAVKPLSYCSEHQDDPCSQALLKAGDERSFFELRNLTMNSIELDSPADVKAAGGTCSA